MKIVLTLLFLFFNLYAVSVGGNKTRFNAEQVEKDINAQQMSKYQHDSFSIVSPDALLRKGIISDINATTKDIAIGSADDFFTHIDDCSKIIDTTKWTASLYGVDLESGKLSCLVAPVDDLENPLGVFDITYPKAQILFTKDLERAKEEKSSEMAAAESQFNDIFTTIKQKQDAASIDNEAQTHISIPEIFTSIVLTDTNIIDVQSTRDTGKLQLDTHVQISEDAMKLVTADAENIFSTYSGLSDVSMSFFVILIFFFSVYGLGKNFLPTVTDMVEGKQNYDKKIPYIFGMVVGALLFIPTSVYNGTADISSENGKDLAKYDIMDTKWQSFERDGYSLFSQWADAASLVIINSQMQSIINKSGVGTASQIQNTYAGKIKYENMKNFAADLNRTCNQNYDLESMKLNGKPIYSDTQDTLFPTSENYGYAMALHNGNGNDYYLSLPSINFYSQETVNGYNDTYLNNGDSEEVESIGAYYYPKVSLAACGKNYFALKSYEQKYKDYDSSLKALENPNTEGNGNDANKLAAIRNLVEFQYGLYETWGYLAVLGLPVVKMQTEMIGGLYKTDSDVVTQLNKEIGQAGSGSDNSWMHSLFSSIPYLFVPGAGTVFDTANKTISTSLKGFTSIAGLSWIEKIPFVGGLLKKSFDGVIDSASVTIAFGLSYQTAKTILELSPIIGIIILGIFRYVVILLKIFGLHFAALFLLPIAFAKENIGTITKFAMKVFATMLEIPLFVIGVWLAITANSLIHSLGDVFGKKIILGMIGNNDAMRGLVETSGTVTDNVVTHLIGNWTSVFKLYLFDGFIELSIAVFSIVLIYKIIISYHHTLLDAIEVQGSRAMDDALESMRNEASGWGAKI